MTTSATEGGSSAAQHPTAQHPTAQHPTAQHPTAQRATAQQRQALGAYGEGLAARHLTAQGMVLLDRNWRCELGEIDLVLRDGPVLVVCEVKTRSSTAYGSPLEAVSAQKARRMRRLAARWLADHEVRPDEVRLDLVGVLVPSRGAPAVEHVPGVA